MSLTVMAVAIACLLMAISAVADIERDQAKPVRQKDRVRN